ncbi:MAG: glutamine amidotransferase [Gammaproteobacteria bacterium]
MKTLLAMRHVPFEGLGNLETPLSDAGYAIRYVDAPVTDFARLDEKAWDLVVILGGPIGVNDQADYPFLGAELRLLEARLAREAPTLGICLGSQLIAHALGARVHTNPQTEIGWQALTLTPAGHDSSLRHFTRPVFHWHGDSFELPAGARLLASTPACAHQAFALGNFLLALQFHPEVTARGLEQWYVGHARELRARGTPLATLRAEAGQRAPALAREAAAFLGDWLRSV